MKVPMLLAAKGEMVIGALLVVRHRAVRLAMVLATTVVLLVVLQGAGQTSAAYQSGSIFLISGSLAAVAGSRLMAPGAALAASRQAATVWWLVPTGRLIGALGVVLPVVTASAIASGMVSSGSLHLSVAVAVATYSAAVTSSVLALSPVVGASLAAAIGFVSVWVGFVPPRALDELLAGLPVARYTLVPLWHVLPFQWRAARLLNSCLSFDALLLIGWTVAGVVTAGWMTSVARLEWRSAGRTRWRR
jgi:hypothetical protein